MRDNDLRFWEVLNGYKMPVNTNFVPSSSIDAPLKKLRDFFENTSGSFTINLWPQSELMKNGHPKGMPQSFEVVLQNKKLKLDGDPDETPVPTPTPTPTQQPLYGLGDPMVERLLAEKEEKSDLKNRIAILELQIENLKAQHQREKDILIAAHTQELASLKDNRKMMETAVGMLTTKLSGGL
jgi:hypothetical protein